MIYFISDTHFGHSGSLKWNNGSVRPMFKSVQEADETMIENWNKTVSKDDVVYFLGDFAYKCSMKYSKQIFFRLNGHVVLIIGNHDYKLGSKLPFIAVYDLHSFIFDDKEFVLCHYPIYSWKNKNKGSIHLHGHTHEQNPKITGKIFNVSVENINYTPISITDIIEKTNTL